MKEILMIIILLSMRKQSNYFSAFLLYAGRFFIPASIVLEERLFLKSNRKNAMISV